MNRLKFISFLLLLIMSLTILCSCGGVNGKDGIDGKDGTSLLTGNGVPSSTVGISGDSYIDLETWDFYTKTIDGWVSKGNIKASSKADHDGTEGLVFYPISDTECAVGIGNAIYAKEITIPSRYKHYTVTKIAEAPFGFSESVFVEKINLPDTVVTIGDRAFKGCINLKEINLPNTVVTIGKWAFIDCEKLKGIVLPNSITSIGTGAFSGCQSLESVKLPNDIQSIDALFYNCTALKSVEMPDSVTLINGAAFNGCSSLTSLVIKRGVTVTGNYVFHYCDSLTIYCEAETEPEDWDSGWAAMFKGSVYWAGQWEYDVNGNPVPLN